MDVQPVPVAEQRAVRSTYRSLRLGVVALLVMLVVALTTEALRAGCWLGSLSAYYWTGAHDAVVGTLCAVGTLLVVYTGPDDVEDALLDVAGFLAFVVALVPTGLAPGCDGSVPGAAAMDLADPRTSLTGLVVAGVLAVGTRTVVSLRSGGPGSTVLARAAGALVVLVVALGLVAAPDVLVATAHDVAAVLLFVAVIGVVVRRAFRSRAASHRWAVAYSTLGAAMLLTLSAVVALHATVPAWEQSVLVLEAVLVALFAGFWLLQTVELWHDDEARPPRRGP